MIEPSPPNRLSATTSPYLLQHRHNPVDWWPWCDEALQLARETQRPILLSIGYSACHWCHVMAHESFEDAATAQLMNSLYVNIKVDREERPDLDKIYQNAHQLLTRRPGGWPLTVFLMPDDLAPFFVGTYFPPQAGHGRLAFPDLLQRVHTAYHEQGDAIREQNRTLVAALERLGPQGEADSDLGDAVLQEADHEFGSSFDGKHGGFGAAPKFPHPSSLRYLLRRWQQGVEAPNRHMLLHTLTRMAEGGMNDLIGGGFCRYSTDDRWMIPHFEKMLYDNGPLLALYADAWRVDEQRPLFAHVCRRTAEWVIREMQADNGGYYSSLDADSEGEEGRFYVWQRDQIKALLSDEEYQVSAIRYGLDRNPNFEGQWHLHTFADTQSLQRETGLEARAVRRLLRSTRDKLLAARALRQRPDTDEKILTSWNALMITGMARAGRLLGEPDWLDSARRAADYLHATHWRDGRLLATSKDGQAHLSAYLDDHAFLIEALLELLQSQWRSADLQWAIELAECLLEHFEDSEKGGFFFTANDHERLLLRPKTLSDEAIPSGNGVAARSLARLGHLLGETRYLDAAQRVLDVAGSAIKQAPHAHASLLYALIEHRQPNPVVVIRADTADLVDWLAAAQSDDAQSCADIYAIANDVIDLPGLLQQRRPIGHGIAYLCRGSHCEAPIDSPDALSQRLKSPD